MKGAARFAAVLLASALVCPLRGQQPFAQTVSAQGKPGGASPRSAVPAEKSKVPGVPNFGKVNAQLYRSGQPSAEGFGKLKEMGVEIVVNFREDAKDISRERKRVEELGMRFVSIPWSAWDDPNDAQVAEFLSLVRANPERRIFVHCKHGRERTGTMLAAYRMALENWTPQQAADEMERFGFRGFWFRHLKKYVRTFRERLHSDPDFAPLHPAPAAR
jgi:protein tyrosine/serine phosphatase